MLPSLLLLLLLPPFALADAPPPDADVVIVGAGWTGLVAATAIDDTCIIHRLVQRAVESHVVLEVS